MQIFHFQCLQLIGLCIVSGGNGHATGSIIELDRPAYSRWFEYWQQRDYSWDGLLDKPWLGRVVDHQIDNLQQYWRFSPCGRQFLDDDHLLELGLLEKHYGKLWHAAHLPPTVSGNKTWKSDLSSPHWGPLERELALRLGAAAVTVGSVTFEHEGDWKAFGLDGRANLDGVITRRAFSAGLPHQPDGWNVRACDAAILSLADFTNQRFASCFQMLNSHFADGAGFRGAVFDDYADMSGSTFAARADFNHSTFRSDIGFNKGSFELLTMNNVDVAGSVWLMEAQVHQGLLMERASLQQSLRMDGLNLGEVATISLRRSRIDGPCDLSHAELPGSIDGVRRAFENTSFGAVLVLEGVDSTIIAAMGDAFIPKGVALSEDLLLPEAKTWRRLLAAIRADASPVSSASQIHYEISKDVPRVGPDVRASSLEAGARTLKAAMEGGRNESRQLQFLRLQLRLKLRRSTTSITERVGLAAYAILSDYGSSVSRPWLALLIGTLLLALAYVSIGMAIDPEVSGSVYEILRFSASRTFIFLPWGDPLPSLWTKELTTYRGPLEFILIAIEGLQAAAGSLCLFLFGLAVRRRLILA